MASARKSASVDDVVRLPAWLPSGRVGVEEACRILLPLLREAEKDRGYEVLSSAEQPAVHPYSAPEQLRKRSVRPNPRLTVYVFGALLYRMVTGLPPYRPGAAADLTLRILNLDPPPVTAHVLSLPPSLAQVVARAMARSPRDRYAGAGALRAALGPFIGEAGLLSYRAVSPALLRPRESVTRIIHHVTRSSGTSLLGERSRPWLAASLLALAALLLLALVLALLPAPAPLDPPALPVPSAREPTHPPRSRP